MTTSIRCNYCSKRQGCPHKEAYLEAYKAELAKHAMALERSGFELKDTMHIEIALRCTHMHEKPIETEKGDE